MHPNAIGLEISDKQLAVLGHDKTSDIGGIQTAIGWHFSGLQREWME